MFITSYTLAMKENAAVHVHSNLVENGADEFSWDWERGYEGKAEILKLVRRLRLVKVSLRHASRRQFAADASE